MFEFLEPLKPLIYLLVSRHCTSLYELYEEAEVPMNKIKKLWLQNIIAIIIIIIVIIFIVIMMI